MRIITISGHAQNGKDTAAAIIKNKLAYRGCNVLITHYADLLKYICYTFFGWDGKKDEWGRTLLQYVGTDVIREIDPNYWVDFISSILKFFGDNWDWVIIPDARFPNEIERLRQNGFDVTHIRIVRDNFKNSLTGEQLNHPSETALDGVVPDFCFQNNGTIDDLDELITTWIKENTNEKQS
ncbi:MAG: hypothetical protein J6Y20_11490 [Lachnospiraceae bacterium]|nr:hypothetical protein [Lachnospiraceae bacterium]